MVTDPRLWTNSRPTDPSQSTMAAQTPPTGVKRATTTRRMATTMALPQYASSKDVDGAAAGAAASFARAVKERARRVLAQTKVRWRV